MIGKTDFEKHDYRNNISDNKSISYNNEKAPLLRQMSNYQQMDIIDVNPNRKKDDSFGYKMDKNSYLQDKLLSDADKQDGTKLLSSDKIKKIISDIKNGYKEVSKSLNEDVVLVIGKTGSGKSTLVNYLADVKLEGYEDEDISKIRAVNDKDSVASICDISGSGTTIPNRVKKHDITFWDCPGFEDNRGADQDITNAFYITHIIKNSKSIKICALIEHDSTKGKNNDLADFAEQIDRLFGRDANSYKNSLSIVVTHTPQNQKLETIKKRLEKMVNEANNIKNKDVLLEVIKNKLSLFKEPNRTGEIDEHEKKVILRGLKDLNAQEVTKNLKLCVSIAPKTALAAIEVYQEINSKLVTSLKKIVDSSTQKYKSIIDNKNSTAEKLEECAHDLKNYHEKLPNVITIEQLGIAVENNKKLFDEYSDGVKGQYVVVSKEGKGFEVVDCLNAVKFLENIVLDYAKFEPVDLHGLIKKELGVLHNHCLEQLKTKKSSESIQQSYSYYPKQAEEKSQPIDLNPIDLKVEEKKAKDDIKKAKDTYEKKKETSGTTKVVVVAATTATGAAVGAAAVLGSMEVGATFGAAGGPAGIAVGAGVGLVIGGLFAIFN